MGTFQKKIMSILHSSAIISHFTSKPFKKIQILSSLQKKPLFEDFECPCCNICIIFRSYIIYSSFLFVCSLTSNLQNILYYKKLSLKKKYNFAFSSFFKNEKATPMFH